MSETQQAQEAFRQCRETQMIAGNARQHHLESGRYNTDIPRQREAEQQRQRENGGW